MYVNITTELSAWWQKLEVMKLVAYWTGMVIAIYLSIYQYNKALIGIHISFNWGEPQ